MNKEDRENLLDSIFPVGEERWIKLKYLDRDKCSKMFRLGQHTKQSKEHAEEIGFEVTSIGVKEEFIPQVAALMDVRDEVVNILWALEDSGYSHLLDSVREVFKDKINEIKDRTIKDVPIENI